MNRPLHHTAFAAGLIAVAWVGAGYFPGHLLALSLVGLIGAFYLLGAFELHRFQQATDSLGRALQGASTQAPPTLADWLAPLHPSLHASVRLRVEGGRSALPGPVLTPYLTGLLVLLGMLGTFLGMVVTLKGTGLALEHATDVEAIRASLSAPVQGLGLAFGCSVAGVAASAMLGLMSTLARRERLRQVQQLDALRAGPLRAFSHAHQEASQREESLRLLRAQADAMPAVVSELRGLVEQMTKQGQALHERLLDNQTSFQAETQRAYKALAASVDESLRSSLADSARLAGAAIEPAVQATMAGLAREAGVLREAVAEGWQAALAAQREQGAAAARGVQAALDQVGTTFATRADALVDGVAARLDASTSRWTASWGEALARQREDHVALVEHTHTGWSATQKAFEDHAAALLKGVADAQAAAQSDAAARERERLAAFHDGLTATTQALGQQSERSEQALAARQQQICSTLEATAQAITAQAEAHARATIDEISRLVQSASEAPRVAAEVIGELRSALSDSLLRDNAALEERNRLLATLSGLLDAVNHASTEQRAAIDALVSGTTDVLERVGARFHETVAAESRSLEQVVAQVAVGAAEVASLGEGFGAGVELFSRASEQLTAQLQRVEGALGQSLARSDEQLAYYVAQAREIVDLTLGSHKQIVEDLQQIGRTPAEADAA
ncbi:DUF802 domain-containing protein [Sphaerotilaceae bacterium SBD11-9]